MLVHLANPASMILDSEAAVVAYTDHNVVVLCWNEGHPCDDDNAVLGLPFCEIDEVDSVKEGVGDTCNRD